MVSAFMKVTGEVIVIVTTARSPREPCISLLGGAAYPSSDLPPARCTVWCASSVDFKICPFPWMAASSTACRVGYVPGTEGRNPSLQSKLNFN